MANRSNRRRVSLSRAMAFEAAFPISPRRADAHHGQEAPPSANRPDIRAQSHLGARTSVRSCKPRDQVLISLPVSKPGRHRSIHCEAERAELSTAARPPACQRGAQPAGRPWITPRTASEPETPTAFPCLLGGVHIRPTRMAMPIPWMTPLAEVPKFRASKRPSSQPFEPAIRLLQGGRQEGSGSGVFVDCCFQHRALQSSDST